MNLLQACYTRFINFLGSYNEFCQASYKNSPKKFLQISYELLIIFLYPSSKDIKNFLLTYYKLDIHTL
jgi:hypothetical protein